MRRGAPRVHLPVERERGFPTGEGSPEEPAVADRARTREEARHAAELLELGDAFLEVDREWRIVRVNANQERISRKPRSETLGRVLWEVWPETTRPESSYWREYRRCMAERVPVQFEEYFAPLDLWTGVTAYPTGIGIALFFRDITAQKRAEQALRDSEERARTLFTAMEEGFAVGEVIRDAAGAGCDFRLVQLNDAFERLTGLRGEDVRGRPITEALPGIERVWIETYCRVAKTGVAERFESYSGNLGRWFSVTCYSPGEGRFAVLFSDVTERRRSEQRLRESEERFRILADAMPQLVWSAGPDGTVDYYNCRAAEFAGIARRPDGTWEWAPVLHPADVGRTVAAWRRAVETGEMYEVEHRVERGDGTYRWHLSRAVPARDASGRVVRWYGTATDIEDQKRAEQALREADGRKTEFLAVLSHELRNPLAPIGNSVYILDRAHPGSEQARRAREVIARQAAHLGRIVDDLLDVTRVARGKVELQRARLDLGELVRRTGDDHRAVVEARGVELAVEAPGAPLWIDGDPTRLAQIMGNLLGNALRFTPGGGRISLSVARVGEAAELRVADTGAGIEPELLPRIFEPFTQGAHDLARSQGGLGLGLALVKGLAELHGGTVRAASAGPGRGAELVVSLPLASGAAALPAPPDAAPAHGGRRRVLVVDDNEDAADSLAELLRLLGHAVDVAYDGPSALAHARAEPPDAVLCDLGLPGMSGYDVARQLRAAGAGGARLIAVSGYAQPEDVERALQAGFDAHVAKPPDPRRIDALLH
jgi:PAS domain S-box-containing protein